ncbi:MAG: O-antigen ligase family protein [Bacteroidia bacterium]
MELTLKQRIFYFFPVLFCFCLPFGTLVLSGIIILWGISSFFNIEKDNLKNGFKNPTLLLLYTFFFITCISALFSNNKDEGMFNIENKLSLVFLPYYIFCFRWPAEIIKKCLVSFVSGCFFACVYLIVRASLFAFNGHPEYFFYTLFSDLIHASYFAMYLILAISIIVLYYPKWYAGQKEVKHFSILFAFVFIVTVFLCSSKLGIISFFITIPVLIIYRLRLVLNVKRVAVLLAGIGIVIFIFAKIFPGSFERLNSITAVSKKNLDKTSAESTTVRILIWDQCLDLIKENVFFGVGVGDANDRLMQKYKQNGITGALEHKLNAHNQFFQTFIGLGVIGFLLLVIMTLGEMIVAVVKKNFILVLTMLLIVLNFLVESMLQASAGTLFYVFFLCLFSLPHIKDELKE